MTKIINQNSSHKLARAILKKGWHEFEIYHSAIQNEYQGWFIECAFNKLNNSNEIDGIFLGCTLKDAIYTVKNEMFTKELVEKIKQGWLILETLNTKTTNDFYEIDLDGKRKSKISSSTFRMLYNQYIIVKQKSMYQGTNQYYEFKK